MESRSYGNPITCSKVPQRGAVLDAGGLAACVRHEIRLARSLALHSGGNIIYYLLLFKKKILQYFPTYGVQEVQILKLRD